MRFTTDDEARLYVNSQLLRINDIPGGPFLTHIRPQWQYRDLPSDQMDIGHLEWKIYRKSDVSKIGGDVPIADISDGTGLFGYWALRITSDYRLFIFVHGNSSAGAMNIDKLFTHASILEVSQVTEGGDESLARYIEHILMTYEENRYYLS